MGGASWYGRGTAGFVNGAIVGRVPTCRRGQLVMRLPDGGVIASKNTEDPGVTACAGMRTVRSKFALYYIYTLIGNQLARCVSHEGADAS